MGDWMSTYLVIKDNQVINTVVWDGVSDWTPPEGTTVELAPAHVGIGWTRVGGEWIAPEPPLAPTPDPNKVSARAKLAAIGLTEDEITALVGG
jgi:hypothetical protein